MLSTITLDPKKTAFTIPGINHGIAWYGVLFALGFLLAYFVVLSILKNKTLTERLTWYLALGTIIGARLFEVLFYSWPYYAAHPLDIFKIWEGGLASHGGAVGVLVALWLFRLSVKKIEPSWTYLFLLDVTVIGASLVGTFIRIGNFINQEIVGKPSDLPWAITFLHPAEGVAPVPRHPVQLYEAAFYFALFIFLFILRKKAKLASGRISGLFFILLFSFRFFIEYVKVPQSDVISEECLTMGQYLSLPFVLLGLWLLLRKRASS